MSVTMADPIAAAEATEAAYWALVGHPEPTAMPEGGHDDVDMTRSDECDPLDPRNPQHERCDGLGRETFSASFDGPCHCHCHR